MDRRQKGCATPSVLISSLWDSAVCRSTPGGVSGLAQGCRAECVGLALRWLYKRGVLLSSPIFTAFIAHPDGCESRFGAAGLRKGLKHDWIMMFNRDHLSPADKTYEEYKIQTHHKRAAD